MIVFHAVKQGTEAWRKIRRGIWTGSVAIRLLQGKSMPREYDFEGNDATKRGTLLEIASIREYERKYRRAVARPGFITNSVYPNAGYSPDGIDGGWLLESKSFNGERHEALVRGDIPLEVRVQILFGMIITGKRKARLLAYNPDVVGKEELTVIEISYDKVIGSNIRAKLRADLKKRLAGGSVAYELGLVRIEV
jgi:hypothetical protein